MCRHEVFKTCVSPQGSIQDLCLSPGFYWSLYVKCVGRSMGFTIQGREMHQGLGTRLYT